LELCHWGPVTAGHSSTYPGKYVPHGGDESPAVVECQLVVCIAPAGEETALIREEHGAVRTTEHLTHQHRLAHCHLHRLAAGHTQKVGFILGHFQH